MYPFWVHGLPLLITYLPESPFMDYFFGGYSGGDIVNTMLVHPTRNDKYNVPRETDLDRRRFVC